MTVTAFPLNLPGGYVLQQDGAAFYALCRDGAAVGYIASVEGIYVVQWGRRRDQAVEIAQTPSLHGAISALVQAASPPHASAASTRR